MTEDKAAEALRKVTINLKPIEYQHGVTPDDVITMIDISDKLDDKRYCLDSICVEEGGYGNITRYVPFDQYQQFKREVENILDATIVNAKQRESIQKILNNAFFNTPECGNSIL